jgi:hypothetical protein
MAAPLGSRTLRAIGAVETNRVMMFEEMKDQNARVCWVENETKLCAITAASPVWIMAPMMPP